MDVTYEVGSAKRRKDKENTNRETDKKRALRCDWQQTDSEVTIIVYIGQGIDITQIKLNCTETSCLVKLPDGRKWECKLFRPILDEGIGIQQKGSKLIIKMIKKVPEHWSQLEAGDSNCQTAAHSANTFLPYEIQRMKYDWYEKANDETVFCIHVYVKNIKRESLNVMFEENSMIVKFQTNDCNFHQMNSPSNENTIFMWKIALKEAIKPKESTFKLTSNRLEITLRKKAAQRWGSLEASVGSSSKVPNNIWMPAKTSGVVIPLDSPKKQQSSSKSAEKELRRESPHRCRRSPSQGKDDNIKTAAVPLSLGTKSEPIYSSSGSGVIKKPTCMVSPLSKSKQQSQMVSPGLTGLDNLGNTCFMNSVLQCLANTREFRDFFLSGLFQSEINTENPLGMGGKLAVAFAVLLKVLWSGTQSSYAPSKLKTLIGMKAIQFTGFAQHDAQEFMAFLLDGLHEDLNRIKNKPYIENIDSDGRPDKIVADESWRIYKQRNDSIVVDIFQGQYKSKLVCPVCNKVSITFDPFLYLSVPLPKKQRALPIYYFSKDSSRRPIKYVIMLPQDATVDDLKDKVSQKTSVPSTDLRVFEVYKNKIHKNFGKGTSLSSVTSTDTIFVFEVLNARLTGEPVVEIAVVQRITMPWPVTRCSHCGRDCPPSGSKLRRCTNCYRAGYCDQTCQKNHWVQHKSHCKLTPELVGCPFIISLPESKATFSTLCHQMEAYSRYSVDVFQPPLQLPVSSKGSASCTSTNSLNEKLDNARKSDFDNSSSGIGSMSIFDSSSSGIGSMSHSSCTQSTDSEDLSICEAENFRSEPTCSFNEQSSSIAASNDNLQSSNQLSSKPVSDFNAKFENYESCSVDSSKESLNREKEAEDEKEHSLLASSSNPCEVGEECGLLQDVAPLEGKNEPLIRVVFGKQQEQCVKSMPPLFNIHAVNLYGHTLAGAAGEPFRDKGEEPLSLSSHSYLAMDWKNNEKKQSYVLVQSKELEHDYDDQDTDFIKTEQSEVTLGQCLQWFTEPEILAPQEAWYCPSCKEHREATKQLSLWRLPIVLIIQLKRFSFKNLIWRDKIDKMVDFPVRGLDLSPYFCGSCPGDPPIYDLFAVINHHGSILGGHYTSYARCVNSQNMRRNDVDWRLFDDSRVMYVSEANVVTKSAYMLFYRQRGVPFTPTPTVIPHCTRSTSKEQKQKENLLDLEMANVMDSNILSYLGEEPTEMDTVD